MRLTQKKISEFVLNDFTKWSQWVLVDTNHTLSFSLVDLTNYTGHNHVPSEQKTSVLIEFLSKANECVYLETMGYDYTESHFHGVEDVNITFKINKEKLKEILILKEKWKSI